MTKTIVIVLTTLSLAGCVMTDAEEKIYDQGQQELEKHQKIIIQS